MRCNSVGTIVQLGKCCLIRAMQLADEQARLAMNQSAITHGRKVA